MKTNKNVKVLNRQRRQKRIRAKVSGSATRPRLSIFKSNKSMYAQIIDDDAGKTLIAASFADVKGKKPLERAAILGEKVAEKAVAKKIGSVVFDRSGYVYTGLVKAFADGARKGGLVF
jgi:large subunit ribosomal protein L18